QALAPAQRAALHRAGAREQNYAPQRSAEVNSGGQCGAELKSRPFSPSSEKEDMSLEETLKKAAERAQQMGLPYEGALTPAEAHEVLRQTPEAKLVDVRTRAELDWVGRIPGAVEVELLTYPANRPNADFVKQLESEVAKDAPVL